VVRRQGKGTFVSAPLVQHDLVDLHGFYDELVAQGVNPTTELLEFGEVAPPPRVAERLRTGAHSLVHWQRLYLRQGVPFAVAWVYLARKLPKITRELVAKHTSYHIFESLLELKIGYADVSIRAQASTAEMRKLLRMPPATPVIALERVSYLADGSPLEYALYCAHADSYEYVFKVRNKVDITRVLAQRSERGER
jgi:GntR family transcriptional regulator